MSLGNLSGVELSELPYMPKKNKWSDVFLSQLRTSLVHLGALKAVSHRARHLLPAQTSFFWKGCWTANEICVSLQFWSINNHVFTERKCNLRFATFLGDRRRVYSPPHPARRNRVIENKQAEKQTTGKQAGKPIANDEFHVHTRAIELYSINLFCQKKLKEKQIFYFPYHSRRIAMVWNDMECYSYSLPFLLMQKVCIV